MKKRVYLVLVAVLLVVILSTCLIACNTKYESQTIVYASTWKEVKLSTADVNWRDGMVGGNGKTGFITNGSPTSDVITYQNIDYLMPTDVNRSDFPAEGTDLDSLRQMIIDKDEPTDSDVPGYWGRISKFHPGMQLRIDTKYSSDVTGYKKFTNYETAEVGETFSDGSTSWSRKTFTSRTDNVTITSITNSAQNVTLSISIDTISKMAGFGRGSDGDQTDETNILYKELVADNAEYLAQVAHYPDYEYSYLKNGGFGAVSLIIIDGGTKTAKKQSTDDGYNVSGYDASIDIKNAKNVYIITALDRTKEMGAFADFETQDEYALLDTLLQKTKDVSNKYGSGSFSYDAALAPSAEEQSRLFNSASLNITLKGNEEAALTNNELIESQKKSKSLSSALANRVYNQGRYAMICCAGYSMTRLSGMWVGTWDPGWRYIYTMDANVNLQSSGMNTSNLSTFGDGYIRFVYNQIEDWEYNAKAIYGIDNAILCPPHADGETALNDEGNLGYPFRYWNAGAAWMIQPIYEYYQCYGDAKITTLDGDKTLLKDVLLPLLQKNANFWLGLCTPKYYTDAEGNARYNMSKSSLQDGEKYCIVPSYSPENWTVNGYSSTLAVNCAMDISAAKYSLQMAIEIENLLKQDGYATRVESYTDLLNNLPEYQYNDDGSIKEWCANGYNDNNEHRHFSHLYYAWPAFEMQGNSTLIQGAKKAIEDREKASSIEQSKQSHCWLHKGLVLARLKDGEGVENCLFTMLSSSKLTAAYATTGLLYSSLMTNHDITGTSNAYCTDSSLGLIGVINESLLYSNNGEIELLPARPASWEKGEFNNLRARCRANVSCQWNGKKVKAKITSDIDQTITVICNGKTKEVKLTAGKTKSVSFR